MASPEKGGSKIAVGHKYSWMSTTELKNLKWSVVVKVIVLPYTVKMETVTGYCWALEQNTSHLISSLTIQPNLVPRFMLLGSSQVSVSATVADSLHIWHCGVFFLISNSFFFFFFW